MKKIASYILSAILATPLFSCSDTPSDIEKLTREIQSFSVKFEGQQNWSIIDAEGKVLVVDAFASAPSVAMNGIFSVYDSTGITFNHLTGEGKYEPIPNLTSLRYAGTPHNGLIPVTRVNSSIEVVDTNGVTQFSLDKYNAAGPFFSDGLLIVRNTKSNKWGAIDTNGNTKIDDVYNSLTAFNCGHAIATDLNDNALIVDKKGNEKNLPQGWAPFSGNFVYNHAMLVNHKTGVRAVVDTKGEMTEFAGSIVPVAIGKAGIIVMDNTGAFALQTFNGKIIKLEGWQGAAPVSGTDLIVGIKDDGKWIIANNQAKTLYEAPQNSTITPLLGNKAYYISSKENNTFLLSPDFKPIDSPKIGRLEQKLYLTDMLLSDRESDHKGFNTADPGNELPNWMEADTTETGNQ